MKYCTQVWRKLLAPVLAAVALWPSEMPASHFRFGNLNWAPTTNQGQVEFKLTIALRRDETNNYGGPFNGGVDAYAETGDILYDGISNTAFIYGDGTPNTPRLNFVVTAFSTNENWLLAEALDPVTQQRGIRHNYLNAGPYQAGINTCCRLGSVALNNRADGSIILRSLVRPYTANRSPVSTLVPIITVPIGPAVSFTVPATDSDQEPFSFRMATDVEAGPCCAPPNLSINSTSGVVTWNNVGLNTNRFWTAQVVVEDSLLPTAQGVKSSSPVDFLLQISGNTVPPPTCAISPSNTIVVTPGTLVSFIVSGTGSFGQAGGTSTNRIVLNTGGLPAGATMTPALPLAGGARQGVTSTFNWTPGPGQAGTYPILFTITDEFGGQSLCSINVTVRPVADLAILKQANPTVVLAGSNVIYTILVANIGPNFAQNVVVTDALPAGLSNVVVTSSRGSCSMSNGTVTCFLGGISSDNGNDLIPEIRITALAVAGGQLTNTATVTSSIAFDPYLTNNNSTAVVTVVDTNRPPMVAITYPLDGAVFSTPPGTVPIEASAQDPDGFVQRVDFYVDGAFLGTDFSTPFALTLTTNVPGPYTLLAIATDNRDATGTSAPVHVTIQPCDPNLNAAPIPNQTRCVCDEVTFTAMAITPDPVTYTWQHNGTVLAGETNASLTLKNLKPAHSGVYTAVIATPCATTSRSATLTLKGAGNQNPVSFTNAGYVLIRESGSANPYPVPLLVECLPGPVKHLAVTLQGLSHNFPDDIDMLLGSPAGAAVRLMSDAGGGDNLTNIVLTFTDAATNRLSDLTNIVSGVYAPTDYELPLESFPLPAPQSVTTTNFAPFIGTQPNGNWGLFIRDDLGGDGGTISNGWTISIEWQDTPPRLTDPQLLADGSFRATLHGLPRMTHLVEASLDLTTWEPVSTNTFSAPLVLTVPPAPGAPPWRFLRALRCP